VTVGRGRQRPRVASRHRGPERRHLRRHRAAARCEPRERQRYPSRSTCARTAARSPSTCAMPPRA
jgi:hypothetical protein